MTAPGLVRVLGAVSVVAACGKSVGPDQDVATDRGAHDAHVDLPFADVVDAGDSRVDAFLISGPAMLR